MGCWHYLKCGLYLHARLTYLIPVHTMLEITFNDLGKTLTLERSTAGWNIPGQDVQYEQIRCDDAVHVRIQGKNFSTRVLQSENESFVVEVDGMPVSLRVLTERDRLLARMGHSSGSVSLNQDLKSPMPGMVLKVLVRSGDHVSKGDPLLVLESMKMENVLKAAQSGVVAEIAVEAGTSVEKNQLLLRYQ